ncbi:DUF4357 domain-containing protein [Saccharothrix sp. 6-C]|uniref:DUF4357 domain-containing protein n=1 Tax=Saccharothrix sp. 6-C TaxID=2781735 RepID=UPI003FA7438C
MLVKHGSDQIRLTRTYVFDSPSSAASVLSGGSKNGRTEWRDAQGRSLRANQEAMTVAPATEALNSSSEEQNEKYIGYHSE